MLAAKGSARTLLGPKIKNKRMFEMAVTSIKWVVIITTPLFIDSLDFFPPGAKWRCHHIYLSWPGTLANRFDVVVFSEGRVEAGGDFNFGLFHQGPNGAVITYISVDPAPWPTDLTRWVFSLSGESWGRRDFHEFRGQYLHGAWPHRFDAVAAFLFRGQLYWCRRRFQGKQGEIWTRRKGDQVWGGDLAGQGSICILALKPPLF